MTAEGQALPALALEGADAAPCPPPEGRPCASCGELVLGDPDECPHCHGLADDSAGVTVTVPMRCVAGGNLREHWLARRRRVERERNMVLDALRATGATPPPLPVTIAILRTAWNELDPDNLAGGGTLKSAIDATCEWLGVDDRSPDVRVHMSQRVTRERRVEAYGRGGRYRRTVAASTVTLTIRPWRPEDGTDRLRVLARGSEAT